MRWMLAIPLILSAAACDAKPAGNAAEIAAARAASQPMTLKAADGVTVYGQLYKAAKPRALILLFHQAGSSKDEYATIAPRLVQAGYSALAIDQRAGDGLYGKNETADALGHKADYLEARPDLKAALDWGRTQKLPIILWGSSYSSSLIFPLAAGDPGGIVALLSFSPGEYFDQDKQMIRAAAAKVNVPVFIASTNSKDETGEADPIMAALPKSAKNERYVPDHGVHGSSTLIASRNPEGAEANWRAVMTFLNRVTAK
ncbi:MAG TPA: alpha/beta hydrolase [Sphingomicrobium sp.]